jgi:hypothetical protein
MILQAIFSGSTRSTARELSSRFRVGIFLVWRWTSGQWLAVLDLRECSAYGTESQRFGHRTIRLLRTFVTAQKFVPLSCDTDHCFLSGESDSGSGGVFVADASSASLWGVNGCGNVVSRKTGNSLRIVRRAHGVSRAGAFNAGSRSMSDVAVSSAVQRAEIVIGEKQVSGALWIHLVQRFFGDGELLAP